MTTIDTGRTAPRARASFGAFAGLSFVATYSASFVAGTSIDIHDSAAKTVTYYAAGAHRLLGLVSLALAVASAVLFVWFLTGLVRHLGEGPGIGAVMASGSALVAVILVAAAVRSAPVGDLVMDSEARAGAGGKLTETFVDFARLTGSLYDWLTFFGVGGAAAVLTVAVSYAAGAHRSLPRWLRLAGYLLAPVLALVAFVNILVFLAWVVAVAVALLLAGRRPAA